MNKTVSPISFVWMHHVVLLGIRKLRVLAWACTIFSGSVGATPIAFDLLGGGDELLTVDGVTDLQWLDVTTTQGLSYDQVTAGFNDASKVQYGFRYASRQEFEALSINVGLPHVNQGNFTANKLPASVIVNLLGFTEEIMTSQGNTFHTWGLIDNDNPSFSPYSVSRASFSFTDRFNTGSSSTGSGSTRYNINAYTGSFLVRSTPTAVPEPYSIVLFVFGLLGLGRWSRSAIAAA